MESSLGHMQHPQQYKNESVHQGEASYNRRPAHVRQDTDALLSYYRSSIADKGPEDSEQARSRHRRPSASSTTTSSSSVYSSEGSSLSEYSNSNLATSPPTSPAAAPQHRMSVPSEGGSDRRRLVLVEMDPTGSKGQQDRADSSSASFHSQSTATYGGIALVAPPDASPASYSSPVPSSSKHHRSVSEAAGKKTTPRNVGIVGTSGHGLGASEPEASMSTQVTAHMSLRPPVFISPQSRSPSPGSPGFMTTPEHEQGPLVTPEIGQEKNIDVPVASPVIVSIDSLQPSISRHSPTKQLSSSPSATSGKASPSYLNYQPGIHSTAGPLPPPPRANFNIDINSPPPPRPPRALSPASDREALKRSLQLPPSVSEKLGRSTPGQAAPAVKADMPSPAGVSQSPPKTSSHRREGAFSPTTDSNSSASPPSSPPSSSILSMSPPSAASRSLSPQSPQRPSLDSIMQDIDEETADDDDFADASAASASAQSSTGVRMIPRANDNDDGWVSVGRSSGEMTPPRSPSHTGHTPSPPSKSFRNSLTMGLKRMSPLRRSPSQASSSRRHSHSGGSVSGRSQDSRTPSPSRVVVTPATPGGPMTTPQRNSHQTPLPSVSITAPQYPNAWATEPPRLRVLKDRPRIRAMRPDALYCHEVHSQRTAAERCKIYAEKINELYRYDCGLSDWLVEVRMAERKRDAVEPDFGPSHPSGRNSSLQPRNTSGGSAFSDATFPRRPDATTATNLSSRSSSPPPATNPPPLPYPAFASVTTSPIRTHTNPNRQQTQPLSPPSATRPKAGGFFSSLGRKASISNGKREGGMLQRAAAAAHLQSPVSPSAVSSPVSPTSQPRVLTKNPPKPAPQPVQIGSPTIVGGPRAPGSKRAMRSQTLNIASPSLSLSPALSGSARADLMNRRPSLNDLEFERQVSKLADLLPHANRDVLAGYLRRSGHDMLAIGQYLEDEKNGTIRRD